MLDLANESMRYAAEYDGAEWHTSPQQWAHDARRRAAVTDGDWVVDPFVAADLFGPRADPEVKLRRGAALARRRFGPMAS